LIWALSPISLNKQMSYYPTTLCFAKNSSSETNFYCVSCSKDKFGDSPHEKEGVMMVSYHTEMNYIKCDSCGIVLKDE